MKSRTRPCRGKEQDGVNLYPPMASHIGAPNRLPNSSSASWPKEMRGYEIKEVMTTRAQPNMLPAKQEDLGKFTIPCLIEHLLFCNHLCDVGDSVSVMSYTIHKKLKLGALKPTTYLLQLVN